MKNLWKDYKKICKEEARFYKKHWFAVFIAPWIIFYAVFKYLEYKENR